MNSPPRHEGGTEAAGRVSDANGYRGVPDGTGAGVSGDGRGPSLTRVPPPGASWGGVW
jgi:hypothetical protein